MLPAGRERMESAASDGPGGEFPGDHQWYYSHVFQGQVGTKEAYNDGNCGKQMINPNFSTSASAVFFISIFFF